jgi:hypothetical protein
MAIMKKILILTVAIIFAITLTGCFDVERNNPYDPDGDASGEQLVELTGVTYKGNSQNVMANVQIDIGGKTVYSNSSGEYKVQLHPGNYTLTASFNGWLDTQVDVDLTLSKKGTIVKTVTKDIKMFIWHDDFESYSVIANITPPWDQYFWSNTLGNAYINLADWSSNQGVLLHFDDPTAGEARLELNGLPIINPAKPFTFDTVVVFRSTFENSSQNISLFETTSGYFFTLSFDGMNLVYTSQATPMETLLISNFTNTDQVLLIHFELEPIQGLIGYISIFNYQGNAILNPTPVTLSTTNPIPEIEGCEFYTVSWDTSTKADLLVLEVWFY